MAKLAVLDTAEQMWEATMNMKAGDDYDYESSDRVENFVEKTIARHHHGHHLDEIRNEIQQNQEQLVAVYGMMETLQYTNPLPAEPTSPCWPAFRAFAE